MNMKNFLRAVCSVFGAAFFLWFALPVTVHIVNIGNLVGMGLSMAVLLISLFYKQFCAVLRFLWRFFAGKLLLSIVGGFVSICFAAGLVLTGMMIFAATKTPPASENSTTVVVLGCLIKENVPSQMLTRRLDVAYEYLQKNPSARCVVSGGQGAVETATEASVMRAYLIERGLSADRIFIEEVSADTEENIRFSASVMEENGLTSPKNAVIIATDGFHQLRAASWAKREGLTSYALSASTRLDLLPTYYMRELFGLVEFYVFGGRSSVE